MIVKISNPYELNKILRAELLSQTELANDHVLNGLSVNGSQLEKRLENQIFEPFKITDNFVVFELVPRNSDSNVTQAIENKLLATSSYDFKLVIYGTSCMLLAQVIKSRFESEDVRQTLFGKGVYIESITEPEGMNEFINNTMWLRADMNIEVSCETEIEKLTNDYDFEKMGKLEVKTIDKKAEVIEGRIAGNVSFRDGTALGNVYINIYDNNGVLITQTTTNENGDYLTNKIPYGVYTITFIWFDEEISDEIILESALVEQNAIFENVPTDDVIFDMTFESAGLPQVDFEANLISNTGIHVWDENREAENGNVTLEKYYDSITGKYYRAVIKIKNLIRNELYQYYVKKGENPPTFANSEISVKITVWDRWRTYTPPAGSGIYWNLYQCGIINDEVVLEDINEITDIEPSFEPIS